MKDSIIRFKADMPVWLSNSEIDTFWIKEKMPEYQDVTACKAKDISNATRKGSKTNEGATLLLELMSADNEGKSTTLVAKQVPATGLPLSRRLGLAREAMFYNTLAPKIKITSSKDSGDSPTEQPDPCIPKIHYSSGDMEDGSKIVIMEDLSEGFVDSGILFGPGNPNNWKRDLPAKVEEAYPTTVPTSYEVANQTFQAVANVHAVFWRDTALLLDEDYDWLRGSSWMRGDNEASWWASQGMIQTMWDDYLKTFETTEQGIEWDPLVLEIVAKAMKGISWESHRKRLNENTHFCLVHGDFWPGNIMISKESTDTRNLRLLDWEMVGVGSGPQDLGQYILSNMDPRERRECEEKLIRNYYQKLVELGVSSLTWEECWSEYKIGGLERWIWFLVYFCSQPTMTEWAQFFHNQIKEFVHDHGITPEDVTQPRP
eukprot:CAMPEP_0116134908 /NCGR_PEP_ID=MMETSP0329-20121206/10907_1 /TAXON_ID=697910 /ORGANISM="Pseudo-nitzschia arenysensis, Strain B593" /LENGTH=429 /DNA_ID=CAMNT_0003629671 /DNA_START=44 /DNA_END=1333 /DNA_ORIENTATION=+